MIVADASSVSSGVAVVTSNDVSAELNRTVPCTRRAQSTAIIVDCSQLDLLSLRTIKQYWQELAIVQSYITPDDDFIDMKVWDQNRRSPYIPLFLF
jgi:hypothetical protein